MEMDYSSYFSDNPSFADKLKARGQQNIAAYVSVTAYSIGEDSTSLQASDLDDHDFIWERDPPIITTAEAGWEICMRYGDSLSDEFELIKRIFMLSQAKADLAFYFDGYEGDPLIIEGSQHLPRWFTRSDNQTYRLFILNGKLVLIPRDFKPEPWTLERALNALKQGDYDVMTEAEEAIKTKLHATSIHCAHATLPTRIAAVLLEYPQLISILSEYYPGEAKHYSRDLLDYIRGNGTVTVGVRLTRIQLLNLRLTEDDGRLFKELPRDQEGHWTDRSMDLGRKLCIGLYHALAANLDDQDRSHVVFKRTLSCSRLLECVKSASVDFVSGDLPPEDDEGWVEKEMREAVNIDPQEMEEELDMLTRLLSKNNVDSDSSD